MDASIVSGSTDGIFNSLLNHRERLSYRRYEIDQSSPIRYVVLESCVYYGLKERYPHSFLVSGLRIAQFTANTLIHQSYHRAYTYGNNKVLIAQLVFLKFQRIISKYSLSVSLIQREKISRWNQWCALYDNSTDGENIGAVSQNGCVDKFI
jgi:hypothetical protein